MKRIGYLCKFSFLIIWMIIRTTGILYSQEVESKAARILINNIPDTEPPSITLVTPNISLDEIYHTDKDELDIIGEVKDPSGVKFVSVASDIRNINEVGMFSSTIALSPGENKIRLVATDFKDNLQELFLTIKYDPPVVTLADKINTVSRYYGLIIGINKYKDPNLPDLDNPIRDAEKLYKYPAGKLYIQRKW